MAKSAKKTKKKTPMQTAFTRFMLVVAFFILWIGGISVRLVHLQVNQHEWLRTQALGQRRDQTKEKLLRGTIYDRDERALAMSVKAKTLFADPKEIEDLDATAKEVAKVLKLKPNEVLKDLREAKDDGKRFVVLARKVSEDAAQKINQALEIKDLKKADLPKFAGLHWKEEQKRSYPYNTLAAHVIGFSNAEDIGSAGIEQSQDELLHGAVIKGWQDRDRLGRVYDEQATEEREPPKDVVLTISNSIQYKTEQALEKGVKAASAKSGMAIVLDPKTGEILAMANYPTFDPNKYNEFPTESYVNKAVQSMYSPGSVFKLVTYGAALQEKTINADGVIEGKSFIEVGGRRFNDKHASSQMSYEKALAVSSNYAAIKTAVGLGKDRFYDYSRKFGFGSPTGIELPAEANGQIRPPQSWFGDSLASMSIGYELNVTVLQAATAYGVVANNGVRVRPHIVKEIRQDGKTISKTEAEKTQIISPEVARNLRRMLKQVVTNGTAKRAQLNGWTSAGKTGTAWKYNAKLKKYDASAYVSSFIGFAPADNPSVVIAVVMDEPQVGGRDGGQVSAPIFREIAEAILPELNVAPDGNIRQDVSPDEDIPTEIEAMTASTNKSEKSEKTEKTGNHLAENEKPKETKKENQPAKDEDKKFSKQKQTALMTEKPKAETKNKSSGVTKGKT
jgi:cell division protein FtsI/penicillin-binding protein 2